MSNRFQDNPRQAIIFVILGVLVVVAAGRFLFSGEPSPPLTEKLAAVWDSIEDHPEADRPAALRDWINQQSPTDAVEAIQSLVDATGKEALPYLAALLRQKHHAGATQDEVRRTAINLIGRIGNRTAHADLILPSLIDDEHEAVRAQAAQQLGSWHIWDAMPHLIAAMRNEQSVELRRRAWQAVMRMIGTDYRFNASGSPAEREAIVARLERDWRGYEGAHRDYVKRKYGATP